MKQFLRKTMKNVAAYVELFLVELNFLLLEPVVTLCIYRYDKWAKLFHTAVPECLRHSEISPLCTDDFLNLCCGYYCISCREYAVNGTELFTCRTDHPSTRE